MLAEMPLDELREARAMTQAHLAKILGVNQAAVSKLERRTDMYVSTLQDFVKAMGGELKITARFPEGTVEISQFEAVKKAAGEERVKSYPPFRKERERMGHPATFSLRLFLKQTMPCIL
jgi:transcriptional regulator with XRE-family HTH domain